MKTLIAIPCLDMIPVDFASSLINLHKPDDTAYAFHANSLIYDSRNTFVANAIEKGYDRILWLDSDMVFEPDLLERLSNIIDSHMDRRRVNPYGIEYVTALAFKRRMPTSPVIYKELDYGTDENGIIYANAVSYKDYPKDSLFEIAGSGCGAVLMTTHLLERVWERFGPPFQPMIQMGEDLAFCYRAAQLGYKMYCDSRIKAGHVGQMVYTESIYLNQQKGETET